MCGDLDALVRAVGARDSRAICPASWPSGRTPGTGCLARRGRRELHPFRELRSGPRLAPSTPGDCFSTSVPSAWTCASSWPPRSARLADSVTPVDEVHGFRYFDDRDLIGFVDGTENPVEQESCGRHDRSARRTRRSPAAATSSCRSTCTTCLSWNALPTETQERIIGRTKLSRHRAGRRGQAELRPQRADHDRRERRRRCKILRDNMPFGRPVRGRIWDVLHWLLPFAAASPRQMLTNMFIGRSAWQL